MSRLTDIGNAAKRAALLATLERHGWHCGNAAAELGMDAGALGAALRALAPEVYAAAKRDGRITQGRRCAAVAKEGT